MQPGDHTPNYTSLTDVTRSTSVATGEVSANSKNLRLT